jgi:magnesium transporter
MPGQRFDTAAVVAVCDPDGRLDGLVTIEDLLAAPPEARLVEIMDPRPPAVSPATNQEQAAARAVRHGHPAIAVVDEGGRFRGVIGPQRLLSVLLAEHQEDLSRLGGMLHSADPARLSTLESVPRRLWHRLPWLGLGLAGAMVSAGLMNAFDRQLSDLVLIAFFIPGIVYLADAVGTQTETIVIRGLPLGVSIRQIAGREALTGVLIGLLLGAVLLPSVAVIWGDVSLALAVAIAVFAASAVATLVAMALPWLLYRSGRDPAFGSGPLATVVQDLLSLGIYLAVAVLLVG